jgi:nucleoside-diphosphate-sugar epimerase
MSEARILVTGGSGFIGSGLVKALVHAGNRVRVFDNNSRGNPRRLKEVAKDIEFIDGDIRDADAVFRAAEGMDEVHHLAFINGTEFFYKAPELVLDVGVRGMVNVVDACHRNGVGTLILASSSEVNQRPPKIPTDESAPLVVPDPHNPRYCYGAGKLISEVMAVNFGRKFFQHVLIFRPHNIYGPDMGFEHVIPQFALRLHRLKANQSAGSAQFRDSRYRQRNAQFLFHR